MSRGKNRAANVARHESQWEQMDAFIDAARQNSCRAISKSCRRVLDGKSRAASETTWEAMSLFSQICLSRDICFFLPLISSQLPSSLSLNQFTA